MREIFQWVRGVWKLIVLLLLTIITFSYAMFQGGFVSWFLFYSFLPFALYALCLKFYSLNDFSIERRILKREYYANETLIVKVILKRRSFFPLLFLIVEDSLSEQLSACVAENKNKTLMIPGFRKEFSIEYSIEKLPRGEHSIQSFHILTSDLFGLTEKEKLFTFDEKILVYPAYEELLYESVGNHFDQGRMSANERIQRDTTMAVGIREYQHGDRLSWINWKASAKRNEMMIKEFEQRRSHDFMLIMDCSPNYNFENIVTFTASLGSAILRKGSRLGFLSVGDERAAVPIQEGEASQKLLFYHLAKSKDNCPVTMDKVLYEEGFLLQSTAACLLVTSQISPKLIDAAGIFTARKCTLTIFLLKSNKESLTATETSLKRMAQMRGINVKFVQGPPFSTGLLEVMKR